MLKTIKVFNAVITATWDELQDIGVYDFLKGDEVKIWEFNTYKDKEHGDCAKLGEKYDTKRFLYIPHKYFKVK